MRRHLAAALATAYAALLALAALPPEVRPHFLDAASDAARVALRGVAIRPGVAVFEAPRDDAGRVVRADCIRVTGVDASGASSVLAPASDRCFVSGVRARVPWTEGALRSLVLRAPPGVAEAALGDWLCHGPHWRAHRLREIRVAWTQPWIDRRTGEEGIANAALFAWRCDPPGLVRRVLRPSDTEMRELGGP